MTPCVMAGCQVTSLWKVFSDQYLAFSTVNMSSCSSSKFPLGVGFVGSDTIKWSSNDNTTAIRVERYLLTYLQGIVMGTE